MEERNGNRDNLATHSNTTTTTTAASTHVLSLHLSVEGKNMDVDDDTHWHVICQDSNDALEVSSSCRGSSRYYLTCMPFRRRGARAANRVARISSSRAEPLS